MWIQYILLIALAATTALTWYRASRQAIRPLEALGWTIVWIGAGVIVCLPSITTKFANLFGVGRGADFVIYIAVFVLFLLVFHLHVVHDRVERSITELVRHNALKELPDQAAEQTVAVIQELHE